MSKNPFLLTKSDILEALNFANSDQLKAFGIGNLQNLLASRNTSSTALDALQTYGPALHSPSLNFDHNIDPSTPGSSASCEPFSELNLKTVDEEDEFLYGKSNPDVEEQSSVREEPTKNASRLENRWSDDDDDPYGDPRPLSKLNSRLRKNLTESVSKDIFQPDTKVPNFNKEEKLIQSDAISADIPTQQYAPHSLQSDSSVLSSGIERNNYPEISSTTVETKSKYHAAAEILKKRKVERTNSPSEISEDFPGTSKRRSEERSLHSDLKSDKSSHKKPIPRTINKKHIDTIRDYITAPQRKRAYPEDFPPEKHSRYETSKTSSFSPSRRHSPHRSSLSSYKPSERHASAESDHTRHSSSYSRHRSPSNEFEKHHHPRYPESHRRFSPSPKRWSRGPGYKYRKRLHEKGSEYSRYKDRSPRSRRSRSRSRSPGYYSSRSTKTFVKKKSKSPKRTDYYSKKKKRESSESSFCSISLGSSTSSSDESSDGKKSWKKKDVKKSVRKSPEKTIPKDNKKTVDETPNLTQSNLQSSTDIHPVDSFPKDNLTMQLSNIFNAKDSKNQEEKALLSTTLNHLMDAVQPPDTNTQLLVNVLEKMQQNQQLVADSSSVPFTSPSVTGINIASNMQMPMIPPSDSYIYPSVPAAPVQYMAPQMPDYSTMMPTVTYSAPVMAAPIPPTPSEYGPYLTMPTVSAADSQYITNVVTNTKSTKAPRPTTLRTIPMSDNLHISPPASANITVVPTNLLQKSKLTSQSLSLKSDKQSLGNKILKDNSDEKNVISSSKLSGERNSAEFSDNTSEKNKLLIIEKYKRLKAERTKAQICATNASKDLNEMRKMLEQAFGKKPSASENLIFTKCKNIFNTALDEASRKNKDARQSDVNLNNYRSKLPTALQNEVKNIKSEDISIEEPETNVVFRCLDQGDHVCYDCSIGFTDIKTLFHHILTPEHKQQMEASGQEWKKDFVKQEVPKAGKKEQLKAVKGAEFVKPLSGFYCSLCKEVCTEESDAEAHVKGHQHYVNYQSHVKKYPSYEKRLEKRCLGTNLEKEIKKEKIINENIETAHKNENKVKIESAHKGSRWDLVQDPKETGSSSEDEFLNDVQKMLSGKKPKKDVVTAKKDAKKEKIIHENIETAHKNENKVKIESARKANRWDLVEDPKETHSGCSSEDENLNDVQRILSGKKPKKDVTAKKDVKKEKIINKNSETACKNENKVTTPSVRKANRWKLVEDPKETGSSSEDENLNDVQKILAGKQPKKDVVTKSNTCKKVINTTVNKFIFIGKSPGYRKKLAEKDKPWYKRPSVLSKNEDSSSID